MSSFGETKDQNMSASLNKIQAPNGGFNSDVEGRRESRSVDARNFHEYLNQS